MKILRKAWLWVALVAAVIGGGVAGASIVTAATAATGTPAPTDTPGTAAPSEPDDDSDRPDRGKHGHAPDGHDGDGGGARERGHGQERPLTGDAAARVTEAALAAHPGATIERVETDADGAAYEAHIVQADGTRATVKLDSAFTVTETEEGR
jgi:hypothetical protein